ncbi:patatin-like phospholipase domain-containing protein 4, partial [Moschus berezovskii]|uniref:patatin-like phospholipase domain-containing protein 4 n=1 Tax=Moschus berezovskii TaxID=68408 RepID=UPI00244376C2
MAACGTTFMPLGQGRGCDAKVGTEIPPRGQQTGTGETLALSLGQSFAASVKHINLFAACGFLGIYHLGAASTLCKHSRKLLKVVNAFAGASAGSLVASVLLTAPQKIEDCNNFTYDFAKEIRRQSFGALTPGYDFMARLTSGVESILPANAPELAQGSLHISITNTRTRQNYLVSSFPSERGGPHRGKGGCAPRCRKPASARVHVGHSEHAGSLNQRTPTFWAPGTAFM